LQAVYRQIADVEWQFRSGRNQRSTKADCPTKNAVGFFDDVGGFESAPITPDVMKTAIEQVAGPPGLLGDAGRTDH
jgi:hypothetical protein